MLKAEGERAFHRPSRPVLNQFRTRVRESVDSVFLSLIDAMEGDDRMSWDIAKRPTGDRTEMMREVRAHYMEADPPLREYDLIDVLVITSAVEGAFFVLSKVEQELNPYSGSDGHVPLVRPARRSDHAGGAVSVTISQVPETGFRERSESDRETVAEKSPPAD